MSRWKTWATSAGAILIFGGALVMKSCGSDGSGGGPGDEQITWYDNLTNTLDSYPVDCSAVGPSCSGFVTAAASELQSLDAAVLSWDDADTYKGIHKDAADAQKASDRYDALSCMSMSYSDANTSTCYDLLHQSLDALDDAHERLLHGGENPLAKD